MLRGYSLLRGVSGCGLRAGSTVAGIRAAIVETEARVKRLEQAIALVPDPSQKRVSVVGAGRSALPLIRYLLDRAEANKWSVVVADADPVGAAAKIGDHPCVAVLPLDVGDPGAVDALVKTSDVVVSMVPAFLHEKIMAACVPRAVPVVTASYATPALRAQFDAAAKDAGIPLIMECGVDPGIDHMSAMAVLDDIKGAGGDVREFRSYTGGLVTPESTLDNPWKYKLSWNPRNVVLAGQGVSRYLQTGVTKFIPYNQLFSRAKNITFPDGSAFEAYANRNSLPYIDAYDLGSASTVVRGTLRYPGFCEAWNVFVQLGLTDDSFVMEEAQRMTYAEFLASFLPWRQSDSVELLLAYQLQVPMFSQIMEKMRWLGLFSDRRVDMAGTPAQILEQLLKDKWRLRPGDRDLIAMLHRIAYVTATGESRQRVSALKVEGSPTDPIMTAMGITVSMPVAIMTKRVLMGESFAPGIVIPTDKHVYEPILDELAADHGIVFTEHDAPLEGGLHVDHLNK